MDRLSNFPDIAAEWHPTRNGTLTPKDVSVRSSKKYWWQCKKGHEWQTSRKKGCPYCINKIVCQDNCLEALFPDIAAEWHPTRNGTLTPKDIVSGSSKKYWWQCKKGHEWQTSCNKRVSSKRGCAYCKNQRVCQDNCLETLFPDIAAEWHSTRNGTLTPKNVVAGSGKKYWWQCKKGHEWQISCDSRTSTKKTNCPYCENRCACQDNCLEALFPDIATEWHPTKNGTLIPKDVMAGSHKKYWWQCKKGHEWQTTCSKRTSRKQGCPTCCESRGEVEIRKYLINCQKNVKPQHRVKNIGVFDFATYKKSIVFIEYHGKQHYCPISFGSKKPRAAITNLIGNIHRDRRKEQWCKQKGHPLLIIPYWDYDIINEILDDFFAGKNPTFSPPPADVVKYEPTRQKIIERISIKR